MARIWRDEDGNVVTRPEAISAFCAWGMTWMTLLRHKDVIIESCDWQTEDDAGRSIMIVEDGPVQNVIAELRV